jgi:hypothetical protein
MRNLHRFALLPILPLSIGLAQAQDAKLGEILDRNAQRLSKADLEQLLPGATIASKGQKSDRSWSNNEGGKVRGSISGAFHQRTFPIHGSWEINDKGQYCVDLTLDIPRPANEKWCRFIYKLGDEHYAAGSLENRDTNAFLLKIKR